MPLARYTRRIMDDLTRHGRTIVLFSTVDLGMSVADRDEASRRQGVARNRISNAARQMGLLVNTHVEWGERGGQVVGTVRKDTTSKRGAADMNAMRTNKHRAADACVAFRASPHAKESNGELTNLLDLIGDLMHLADTMSGEEWGLREDLATALGPETHGEFAVRMATSHYQAELSKDA